MTVCFTFDWVNAAPSPDVAMGQTMAQLWIHVNEAAVTSVRDRRSDARRDHIVVPLLGVAEWVIGNWCHIQHEVPGATADMTRQKTGFEQRHNLAFAGDGFLFPKLTMAPSVGGMQQLRWTPWQPQHARIEFVAEGEAPVTRDQLQAELERIVEAVLDRLRSFGHRQDSVISHLQDPWEAIKTLDPDEHEFCRAAALLGVDPFAVHQEAAEAITAFWERTEPAIREDMLASLEEATLPNASPWLDETRKILEREDAGSGNEWAAIRRGLRHRLPDLPIAQPWRRGYALARSLRHDLGCGNGWFDFASSGQPALHHQEISMPSSRMEGLVAAGAPACVIASRGADAARFLCARALGDYMGRSEAGLGVLTSMDTARQAQSRAFAAELLAPAESLRARLAGREAEEDVIRGLGLEFGVSTWLINHQIRNHDLVQPCPSG
ncbi:MAG: hypothetical protein TE42_00740 [Candidatus Synechococcus spongiarum SP3]|uniref:Uncharacterized protein n=1 Tax=Candidatus Synechococcus spongiarum SP3 TaxID=1604020 RepID=A0A0G2HMT3_9SYNE|nr:MAG: hypothetical protein TE42_00740 [Candidatus Synechococcus spongiarum SP3]